MAGSPDVQCVNPATMATPGGHYSHVVVHAGVAYVSGQLPIALEGRLPSESSFEQQARQVLANVESALSGVHSSLDLVLRCTVYIADLADWPEFNRIYAEVFGAHRPARAVVPTGPLHFGYRVEMDAIAAVAP